ncbi:MAG: hypothetical protein K2P88_15830 [Chitinophagaceae bacterium]|uniref:hypothetical protein n=1 Tax=unclassified Paraflavitalea TaxID=2798305 RepID=UPI003D356B5A|nr:hypothetical protein [Chitinophagaceae bacterium]
MKKPLISALFFLGILTLIACKQDRKVTRAMYYWKTVLAANPSDKAPMAEHSVRKLYVKFFDVTWNANLNRPDPAAKIQIIPQAVDWLQNDSIELVPAIFITNECMKMIAANATDELGERINYLLGGMLTVQNLPKVKEIQIDCDWTEESRDKYFALLTYLKTLPLFMDSKLSVTVRMHQCKFSTKMGIPPADRGLLMCYNMGNLKDSKTGNSILEANELEKYIENLNSYPLPLDIALPLFEWKVLFRNNQFDGIISNISDSALAGVATASGNNYTFNKDTLLVGYPFRKGDVLRVEKSSYNEIIKTANLLSPKLRTEEFTLSLFHLDSTVLSKFSKNELETIYNSLNK